MLKQCFHDFLANSTMHGLPNFERSHVTLVKISWVLVTLASLIAGFYNIWATLVDFYNYDVITNVGRADAISMIFPAITVCAKDFYQFRYNQTNNFFLYYNLSFLWFIDHPLFKTKQLNISSDFEVFKIPKTFGNCVRFKSPANETATAVLDILTFNITRFLFVGNNQQRLAMFDYFEFYISDGDLNSFLGLVPSKVSTSHEYEIGITKAEIETKLPEPYNRCSASVSDLYANCIEMCINQEIASKYNCSIPSYYTYKKLKNCFDAPEPHSVHVQHKNNLYDTTAYDSYIDKVANRTNQFYSMCESKCPKECTAVRFISEMTSQFVSNYVSLSFFISDYSSLVINQIPKTDVFSLVSSIGGNLGLFIGISFLSFVEIFEFFIKTIYFLIF